MQYTRLSNGAKMPLLGLGTWQSTDDRELETAIRAALDAGYRLFDTAALYGNEASIGRILSACIAERKVKREELFVITKLALAAHEPSDVLPCLDHQLKSLHMDYVDMFLIHLPTAFKRSPSSFLSPDMGADGQPMFASVAPIDTWREMEKAHRLGKCKAIGVSNFNTQQLKELCELAEVKPANLQIEVHVNWRQEELVSLCEKLGISVTAYGPIGSPGRHGGAPHWIWPDGSPRDVDTVRELADKHHNSAAQILLRYLIQRGISAIPKSTNPDRIKENIDVFDFQLSPQEMTELGEIKDQKRLFLFDMFFGHEFYPFEEVDKKAMRDIKDKEEKEQKEQKEGKEY